MENPCQRLVSGLSEAASLLNTFQALKLKMEPLSHRLWTGISLMKICSPIQEKMLLKCIWTDRWEKIDVKDRYRTFSRSYKGKIIGLFAFILIYLEDFQSHVACPANILVCIFKLTYRLQLFGVISVMRKEKNVFFKAIKQKTEFAEQGSYHIEQLSLIRNISIPTSSKKCPAFGDSQSVV